MEQTENGLPLDYIGGLLDMCSRISYNLELPESPEGSPYARKDLSVSVDHDEIRAGLLEEYFESIGIQTRFREGSSYRTNIRKNEDFERLESSLDGHSIELMRGLKFFNNRKFTNDDVTKNDESVLRLAKTMLDIRPAKRSSDLLKFSPRELARQLSVFEEDVNSFDIPSMSNDGTLSTEYIGGVFDACGSHNLIVSKQSTYDIGYSIHPKISVNRASLHPVTVSLIQDTFTQYNVPHNNNSQSDVYSLNIGIHGSDRIRKFFKEFGDGIHVLLPEMEIFNREILPRFDEGLHQTKQGLFDILYIAEVELDLFKRERKYDLSYFAEKWNTEVDTYQYNSDQ
jgi:hypothetical protein